MKHWDCPHCYTDWLWHFNKGTTCEYVCVCAPSHRQRHHMKRVHILILTLPYTNDVHVSLHVWWFCAISIFVYYIPQHSVLLLPSLLWFVPIFVVVLIFTSEVCLFKDESWSEENFPNAWDTLDQNSVQPVDMCIFTVCVMICTDYEM